VLITAIAAATSRIRVGAGGIMIPNHAPLHVVEVFRCLEALYPNRIDLGLGRAPGTDPIASAALRRGEGPEVNSLLAELVAFDEGRFPPNHPFGKITPMPSDVKLPDVWMLGSTLAGAAIGAELGVRYAFAGHFAMRAAKDAVRRYKKGFSPSPHLDKPHAMLAVTAVAAETDEEAVRMAAPIRVAIAKTRTGKKGPILSIEEALRYPFTPEEKAAADDFLEGALIGNAAKVAAGIERLAKEVDVEEIMLSALIPDTEARKTSLRRILEALG
jgi:luciferase family oxidoreductase group 1